MRTSLFLLGTVILFGFAQSAMAVTSDITLTGTSMVTSFGQPLSDFHVGTQINVQSNLTNHGNSNQKFSYVVQVIDSNGGTDWIGYNSLSLEPNQSWLVSQAWIPQATGQYTIQVFVWTSLTSGIPLTDVTSKQIPIN